MISSNNKKTNRPTNEELNALKKRLDDLINSANKTNTDLTDKNLELSSALTSSQEKTKEIEILKNEADANYTDLEKKNLELSSALTSAQEKTKKIEILKNEADTNYTDLEKKNLELSSALTSAQEKTKKIEILKNKADTNYTDLENKNLELSSTLTSAQEKTKKIEILKNEADKNLKTMSNHESNLDGLLKEAETLRKRIESLLPGATSTGLASAFRERKEKFKWPKIIWSCVFVLSIIALLAISYFIVPDIRVDSEYKIYSGIFAGLLVRLPFVFPLAWLAIYAGRRHGQASRLEEDYAHKEALSKSFEGYKAQLVEIEANLQEEKVTLDLIKRTLEALYLHPDRIYKDKHGDISLWRSATKLWNPKGRPE